ncbi:EF-hand calcium-binding domain-containing protein 5 [Geodia barretti]|uniref:EF-hand calcium-binding domain-containing protein 5 n=1 Tax=Geodia barretti TaxID=519541 RepID=A0AA35SIH7_GEOBA|nr:EF-hand calcium-binding domain-containing protein 5 [Geodia barretti]
MSESPSTEKARNQLCAAESRLSLPLELLAGEWLEQRGRGTSYLMGSLLPTLVLGMDKLLTQVSERGLEETEERQYDFNPVNLLAQYLMRNNPRHTHLPPTHPYSKQLQEVSQQLQQMSFKGLEKRTLQNSQRTESD